MTNHDALIKNLERKLKPVTRSGKPGRRVINWLTMAVPGAAVASLLVQRGATDWTQEGAIVAFIQLLLSFTIGALAVRYAFTLSIAGRQSRAWMALIPLVLLWLALSLWSLTTHELSVHAEHSTNCFTFLMVVSSPMIVLMIASLRRTRSVYPIRSLAVAGLGIASLAVSMLTLCHPVEIHPSDFFMHLTAAAAIMGLTVLAGRRWIGIDR